jgi:hypothetical protein
MRVAFEVQNTELPWSVIAGPPVELSNEPRKPTKIEIGRIHPSLAGIE